MINKKEFTRVINDLRSYDNYVQDINNTNRKYNMETEYGNYKCITMVVDLLKEIFNDKDNWIGYYIYELDYGSEYKDGMVYDNDKDNIRLRTPEDLYDLLTNNE